MDLHLHRIKNDISTVGQSSSYTQPYTGSGFIGELLGSVNFALSSELSLSINTCYRVAVISQMNQAEDISYNGIPGISIPVGKKGDSLKNSDNNDLPFDFSGLSIGVGISRTF
jgi:hypothetical protein